MKVDFSLNSHFTISEICVNICPICHGTAVSQTSRGSIPLLRCSDCDAHFLQHVPSQHDLDAYYSDTYVMSNKETHASEHRRLFRIPEMYWLIAQLEKIGVSPSSSVLDIGCDKGYFLDQCRRFGYETAGVEPSISARAYCRNVGLNVYAHIKDVQQQYDVITMWHVLEHFTEPHALLNECNTKLKPGGIVCIRVPNFDSLWSRILGTYWIWFQPRNHYVHYSKKSLLSLIRQHGFESIHCKSRKPNDAQTFKAGLLADNILYKNFRYKQSLKKKLGRIYEHITGVELFLIARKK